MENPFGVVVGFLLDGTCSHVVLVQRREMFPPKQKMMVTELSETSKANPSIPLHGFWASSCSSIHQKKKSVRPSPHFRQLVHARARDHGLQQNETTPGNR